MLSYVYPDKGSGIVEDLDQLYSEYRDHPLMKYAMFATKAAIKGGQLTEQNLSDAIALALGINKRLTLANIAQEKNTQN